VTIAKKFDAEIKIKEDGMSMPYGKRFLILYIPPKLCLYGGRPFTKLKSNTLHLRS
jgi:hypothetical protein